MKSLYWFIGALIAAGLAMAACDRSESDWQKAKQANTVNAFEEFRKDHPRSAHDGEAEAVIGTLTAWADAEKTGTPDGLFAFAEKHPESSLASKAMETGKKLLFEREPAIAKDFNHVETVTKAVPEQMFGGGRSDSMAIATSGIDPNGSISMVAISPTASVRYLKIQRRVDSTAMSFSGGLQDCTGVGSQIWLGGSGSWWTVKQGVRLCFKRDSAGWVFLCGAGVLKMGPSGDQVFGRSFQGCLFLFEHPDAYTREGVARDLGRLSWGGSAADREKALAVLNRLLDDPNENVRMGALEGLGLLGSPGAFASVRAYAKKKGIDLEKSKKGNERNEECILSDALGTIGGYRIIGVPELKDALSLAEAGEFFANAQEWVLSYPVWTRVSADIPIAEKALEESITDKSPKVREAAGKIAKACLPASEAKSITDRAPADSGREVRSTHSDISKKHGVQNPSKSH